jgi:Zn-dependent alcohol dehydrogenase
LPPPLLLSCLSFDVDLQVCALLNGGGYAEKVVVPAGLLLPVPEGVSLTDAAGLAEVACTVWSTVFMTSHLSPGESFLVRNLSCSYFLHGMIAICKKKKYWTCFFPQMGLSIGAEH